MSDTPWDLFAVGGGLGLAGTALGALGSRSASRRASAAARGAEDRDADRNLSDRVRTAIELFGPDAENYLRSTLSRDEWDRMFGASRSQWNYANQDASGRGGAGSGQGGESGLFAYARSRPGLFNEMNTLAEDDYRRSGEQLGEYDADTARLAQSGSARQAAAEALYRELMGETRSDMERSQGLAREYGQDADRALTEDASRAVRDANARSVGELTSRGLGNSTLVANQTSANATEVNRDLARSRISLRNSVLDREMGARESGLSRLAGLTSAFAGTRAAFEGDATSRDYARAGGRTAFNVDRLNRYTGMRGNVLSSRINAATSSPLNYSGQVRSIVPQTGGGEMASAFGAFAGNLGGTALGYGLQDAASQRQMDRFMAMYRAMQAGR
ncbi:MAG: hypothetical protein SFZ23_08615 [Planctomycetota bacterium]|nr:hypothetical protein [Planctomycetota bacterium]